MKETAENTAAQAISQLVHKLTKSHKISRAQAAAEITRQALRVLQSEAKAIKVTLTATTEKPK